MPGDWGDEARRILHYQQLGKPLDAQTFVRCLKDRLTTALTRFNCVLPQLNHLRNRLRTYSNRRIRQIIHKYALAAGIQKRVYPHLFRHQIITFLTKKGIISPKLQLISGHTKEKSLAIYRDLALVDVSNEYEEAMKSFPVK
jgi:site-specific recombinase XerD